MPAWPPQPPQEAWAEKLRAADALLDRAGEVLDRAEVEADQAARDRLLQLFELYMTSARAGL